MVQGSPEEIIKDQRSYTSSILRDEFNSYK